MISPRTYFDTLRHLKPLQIAARVWLWGYRPAPSEGNVPLLRPMSLQWFTGPARQPSMIGPSKVNFLGESAEIENGCIWQDESKPKLWLYNLHYFDDLNALKAESRINWHSRLVRRWIEENPPGRGCGWEPYPISLRVVNWIKWHMRFQTLDDTAVRSLAVQIRHLTRCLEYHILGNHLLANAKALIFAGVFFSGGEADKWLAKGKRILERELREQILSDGGHFELSPMYHSIVLEDLLDVSNLCRAFGLEAPDGIVDAIERMLAWSHVMRHEDGQIPFFNDAAFGIAPEPAELDLYACRLGFRSAPLISDKVIFLQASGYARLTAGEAVLFADLARVGPDYLPGHAHADTLSFELSLRKQRIVVNCGTSVYGTGPERLRQRGTASHSTLIMDDQNSSEVWGGFRVGRRANVLYASVSKEKEVSVATGAHDGYRFLPGRPVHHRTWRLANGQLLIEDRVSGSGTHELEAVFHLHPDIGVKQDGRILLLQQPIGGSLIFQPDPVMNVELSESTWHPTFGATVPTRSIRLSTRSSLPTAVTTRLIWEES